jgi:FMN phosphatase YigB (HAD superfamily)
MIKAIVFDCFGVLVNLDTGRPDESVFEYIRALKPRYAVAMLSNAAAGGPQRYIPAPLLEVFDGHVYVSGEIGHEKPAEAAFQYVADKLGVQFSEMVFVDDLARFTVPAREYGINAIVYDNLVNLKDKMRPILARP